MSGTELLVEFERKGWPVLLQWGDWDEDGCRGIGGRWAAWVAVPYPSCDGSLSDEEAAKPENLDFEDVDADIDGVGATPTEALQSAFEQAERRWQYHVESRQELRDDNKADFAEEAVSR